MKTAHVLQTMQELTEKHVKLYKTDFYDHDRPRIFRDRPEEFVWMIRETGTHIMTPRDPDEPAAIWQERFDIFSAVNERLYYCTLNADGSGTVTHSAKKCREFAARQSR